MLSIEGRCKALDAAADGYVRAEAVGVMVLEPLASVSSPRLVSSASSAETGGGSSGGGLQHLAAIISGSAVNQDGRSSSLTAPNGPAQQAVLRAALRDAQLPAGYVLGISMHGTGESISMHGTVRYCTVLYFAV